MTVCISAGHHPASQGASNGIHTEYLEAVIWQAKIIYYLDELGVQSTIIPSGHLKDKVEYINEMNPTFAVEIHFNANINGAYGCETLYCKCSERGYLLGSYVQDELVSKCNLRDRGVKIGYYQMNPDKPIDYFLLATKCPAIIVEPEFISNYDKITDIGEEGCHAIAMAIYRAIDDGI